MQNGLCLAPSRETWTRTSISSAIRSSTYCRLRLTDAIVSVIFAKKVRDALRPVVYNTDFVIFFGR